VKNESSFEHSLISSSLNDNFDDFLDFDGIFQVVVAMINLSDEETSNHVDSDVVFKSSTAATTPQDGSLMSSLGPSSIQDIDVQDAIEVAQVSIHDDTKAPPKESISAPENLGQAEKPTQGMFYNIARCLISYLCFEKDL